MFCELKEALPRALSFYKVRRCSVICKVSDILDYNTGVVEKFKKS